MKGESMKEIELTKGYSTKVDDEDYEWLSEYSWHAHESKTGKLKDRNRLRCRVSARAAFRVDLDGGEYAYRIVPMHRMILHARPDQHVDHINGDALDNRRENLRLVTNQQNSWNALGAKSFNGKPTTSRFKGVFKKVCKTKFGDYEYWVCKIGVNGKEITVYHGKDEIEAACMYDLAAMGHFGEYARTNFDGAAYDKWYIEQTA
jgi:hypothetical protein